MQQTIDTLSARIGDPGELQGPANGNVQFPQSGDPVRVAWTSMAPSGSSGGSDIGPFAAVAPPPLTIVGAINRNTSAIAFNASEIQRNALAIATNSDQIAQMNQQLKDLDLALQNNSAEMRRLNNGLAALGAMPDLTLSSDENFAFTGRMSVYRGDLGFGLGMSLRADEDWSLGMTVGHAGEETTGAVQVRFAR